MSNKVAKYYLQSKRNRERKTKNKNMRKDFLKFKTEKRFVLTVVVPQCRGSAMDKKKIIKKLCVFILLWGN